MNSDWRAVAFFVAKFAVCVMAVMSFMVSRWSWAAVLLLVIISVTEYVLPFILAFECVTFSKLTNDEQSNLYVHAQQKSETLQAQARKS